MHSLTKADNWLGLNIQGDIGPYTMYTSQRGQMVCFPRVPPLNPPSPIQEALRDVFRQWAEAWSTLSRAEKAAWATLAWRCNLGITGYNLFCHYARSPNYQSLIALERRAGITVTRPTT